MRGPVHLLASVFTEQPCSVPGILPLTPAAPTPLPLPSLPFCPLRPERVGFQAHKECLVCQLPLPVVTAVLWVSRADLLLEPSLAPALPWGAPPSPPTWDIEDGWVAVQKPASQPYLV